ncbi:MAG: hypothetical protein KJZ86_03420 [Caldilineaceae bacterium]|nr:hypothetical protein [Caldilineaceae bacterium]
MATITSDQIQSFLTELGSRYPQQATLTLLGGSALCLLGSERPTLDIDYVGDDLRKSELQRAGEFSMDAQAVCAHLQFVQNSL